MTRPRDDLTFSEASRSFAYDPLTGVITRRVRSGSMRAGSRADVIRSSRGYRHVSHKRVSYSAQRLAWLLHRGSWPTGEVDHINRHPDDNRAANLRDVRKSLNGHNQAAARRHSSTGVRGVQANRKPGRWRATIIVDKKYHHLGTFSSIEAAAEAYRVAKARLVPGLDEARP